MKNTDIIALRDSAQQHLSRLKIRPAQDSDAPSVELQRWNIYLHHGESRKFFQAVVLLEDVIRSLNLSRPHRNPRPAADATETLQFCLAGSQQQRRDSLEPGIATRHGKGLERLIIVQHDQNFHSNSGSIMIRHMLIKMQGLESCIGVVKKERASCHNEASLPLDLMPKRSSDFSVECHQAQAS
jgi:hypothetical protein